MFQDLKIRTKLAIGFGLLIIIIIGIVLINYRMVNQTAMLSRQIAELRLPTAESSASMKNGVNAVLA